MIRRIWFRSAKGTLKTAAKPGSSGTPPTDQPSEPTSEMERRLLAQLSVRRPLFERLLFAWWSAEATVKHWFGIHTMLPLEEWDFIEEFVQLKGSICWKCDYQL